ncbi:MAG: hypothetical protein K8I00_12005 [Candidatus Omnitrophica bacterium]|nr:hypothetical protein [Candidatus Omnitrophota bacterium]
MKVPTQIQGSNQRRQAESETWAIDPKQSGDGDPVAVYGPGRSRIAASSEQQNGPNYFMIGGPYQNYASPGSV